MKFRGTNKRETLQEKIKWSSPFRDSFSVDLLLDNHAWGGKEKQKGPGKCLPGTKWGVTPVTLAFDRQVGVCRRPCLVPLWIPTGTPVCLTSPIDTPDSLTNLRRLPGRVGGRVYSFVRDSCYCRVTYPVSPSVDGGWGHKTGSRTRET